MNTRRRVVINRLRVTPEENQRLLGVLQRIQQRLLVVERQNRTLKKRNQAKQDGFQKLKVELERWKKKSLSQTQIINHLREEILRRHEASHPNSETTDES